MVMNITECPFCKHALNPVEVAKSDGCPYCEKNHKSTARTRALYHLVRAINDEVHTSMESVDSPRMLAFSMSGIEKKTIVDVFPEFTDDRIQSVSLYGNYLSKSQHISGVDARDLSRFDSESFNVVFSCLLYDYFPEHEKALKEAYRVLSDKGVFITHIAAYRLEDNEREPYITKKIVPRSDYMSYIPSDSEVYDVSVGLNYFVGLMKKVGFKTKIYEYVDPLYKGKVVWFVGIKEKSTNPIISTNPVISDKTIISKIKFDEHGLVPAIVQEESGQVLMLAYMNEESLKKTIETGYTWFYSRSRQTLWQKGETSGNVQQVKALYYDCDGDALLVKVHQTGVACHTGTYSCFSGRRLDENKNLPAVVEQPPEDLSLVLYELYSVIKDRQRHPVEGSYTNYLFNMGHDKILKKVGEEAVETIIASKNNNVEQILYEMGDLWYHCLVLLAWHGIKPEDLFAVLMQRRKGSNYHKFTGKTGERPAD